ncbi:hypothetical protein [Sulfurimonas paralvinellae]|uniref:hypothetical protein n=1 Tax=Sulfurimonas paralvinellae TaxID=317658 RepID=UPI001867EFB6|nr:hypothetical protein [Sulfurimonas paralvinellae]
MKKILFLLLLSLSSFFLSGCVNKHGISAKYYSDCKEYYDLQGYYHKECGDDDIVTYKQMGDLIKKKKPEPTSNVW